MQLDLPARRPASISLTPLIDVVFILLVFFMLATRFIDLGQQPLSVAVTDPATDNEHWHQIEVRADDSVVFADTSLNLTGLRAALQQAPAQPVYVTSEEQATLDQVLAVTDLLRQNGFADIHLELLP